MSGEQMSQTEPIPTCVAHEVSAHNGRYVILTEDEHTYYQTIVISRPTPGVPPEPGWPYIPSSALGQPYWYEVVGCTTDDEKAAQALAKSILPMVEALEANFRSNNGGTLSWEEFIAQTFPPPDA
jgi:hypothetical protein